MKLVSVVVATFRREAELRKALESLTNQTYPHLEIIVVDCSDISLLHPELFL